ncbi:IS701 family transposase [Oleiphilus messinensis]|uniref:IS701 family transposase n=1 Tax=Oleiphilus messinensis TaxID=141451 RepID=A0A1Y0I7P7_9GAMM|nr:transposase [Oleiphilus messinensis]ARU54650.1 IS701 family transposase [Oleiphilus messinensis]ARU54974.1 IS701 family transposase [Oleiphilus messinensis]ARU56527.1 IS701 family transposase [Oleiphilus messinensis]ARU57291.1 IS701 family transposase [Oleiphilus messinensis]ARU58063.1 IS701 family transposase [Oleiphilus messinensis]
MDAKGYGNIPEILFDWITFLVKALPLRSVPTFIELLIGAMLTPTGFVTDAWLMVAMKRHWSSYFKWLQKGKWSWVALAQQLGQLLTQWCPNEQWYLAIDDTLVLRSSKKAPSSQFHHMHGNKANRPQFVRGQCWVSLSAIVKGQKQAWSIPLISRLTRACGNGNKLVTAGILLRVMRSFFTGATVLMDSWYMRGTLIASLQGMGYHVIGQVRKDTALYDVPERTGKRGRPRKYGEKYTPERVTNLEETCANVTIYGRQQSLRYRTVIAKARFLDGQLVKVVWVQFENEDGSLKPARLLLTTRTNMSGIDIIKAYAKRWSIEPMFHQLKNRWGWNETWQQSRQVLHRWVQIISLSYALVQLLTYWKESAGQEMHLDIPWRKHAPITAGLVRLKLQRNLQQVAVRDWWDVKSRIFKPPARAIE